MSVKRQIGRYSILFFLHLLMVPVYAQVFDKVVDRYGKGDYLTITDAINAVPSNSASRTLIFIRNGVYKEKIVIPASKPNVSLVGENAQGVIITWDDYNGKNGLSTANSYTFWADGSGLYAENLTIRNTVGNIAQGVALRTTGDTMVFKNCYFTGFQDTYYAHKKRQYNLRCYVAGGTDFVFGDATTVFDSCMIYCLQGGQYISAPADAKTITSVPGGNFLHGLLFRYCDVTTAPGVPDNSYYLGRPWQPASSSVYIGCVLGPHIRSEGWSIWSGTNNHETSFFAEYKSVNQNGLPVDVTGRVVWSKQLSDETVSDYYTLSYFFRKDGKTWDPKRLTNELPAPGSLKLYGSELIWQKVENAIGYIVKDHNRILGFSKGTVLALDSLPRDDIWFEVKAVSSNGAPGKSVTAIAVHSDPIRSPGKSDLIFIDRHNIRFSEPAAYSIYNASGKIILGGPFVVSVNLQGLQAGVYIVRARGENGFEETRKFTYNY